MSATWSFFSNFVTFSENMNFRPANQPFKCNSKSVVRGQMWVLYVCVSSYFSLVNQDSSQLVRIWQRDDGNVIFTGGVKVSRQVNHQLDPEENTTLIITDAQVSWDIKFPADYLGSPPYAHFGTWKKICYMKFVLIRLQWFSY